MIISKQFKTETAHIVRNAVSERCKYNVHGHSYVWEVAVEGDINPETGMVIDFKELAPIKAYIDKFDHAMVLWHGEKKEIISFFKENFKRVIIMYNNCTAENMAQLMFDYTKKWLLKENIEAVVKYVKVWETVSSCAIADDDVEGLNTCTYIHGEN